MRGACTVYVCVKEFECEGRSRNLKHLCSMLPVCFQLGLWQTVSLRSPAMLDVCLAPAAHIRRFPLEHHLSGRPIARRSHDYKYTRGLKTNTVGGARARVLCEMSAPLPHVLVGHGQGGHGGHGLRLVGFTTLRLQQRVAQSGRRALQRAPVFTYENQGQRSASTMTQTCEFIKMFFVGTCT